MLLLAVVLSCDVIHIYELQQPTQKLTFYVVDFEALLLLLAVFRVPLCSVIFQSILHALRDLLVLQTQAALRRHWRSLTGNTHAFKSHWIE